MENYLQEIHKSVEETSDPNVLDRVISLMSQASAALRSVSANPDESHLGSFEIKERFAPTKRNEVQLKLWQTAKNPGRKRQHFPMK